MEEGEHNDYFIKISEPNQRASIPLTNPFQPLISKGLNEDSDVTGVTYTFNQAYIYNIVSSGQYGPDKDGRKIENMGRDFELPLNASYDWYVQVKTNASNNIISKATFTGYDVGNEPPPDLNNDFPHIQFDDTDEDPVGEFTGYYPICETRGYHLTRMSQRGDIILSNRQFHQKGVEEAGSSALILVESGHRDDSFPVRVKAISAGTGIFVETTGDYIVIHATGTGAGGTGSCENIGTAAEVYVDESSDPFQFRTLRGQENQAGGLGVRNNVTVTRADNLGGGSANEILISGGCCENVGSFVPVYVDESIRDFQFRSLEGRGTVTVEQQGDTHIRISGSCCDLQTTTDYGSTTTNPITFGPTAPATPIGSYPISIISKSSSLNALGVFSSTDLTNPIHELQEDSSNNGENNLYDSNGNLSARTACNTSREGIFQGYNAAGGQVMQELGGDGSGNPLLKQTNAAGTIVNQIAGKSDTDTYFDAGPVAIGDNSTVAGKSLYVKGTTRIQDSSTAGDGKIELGNDATHSIGYSSSKNALNIGAGITQFDADHANQIDLFSSNAASYSAQDAYLIASSPATGSAILAGSGNSISGHYNVITAGANNTISGKSMNFIGGGSGIDITDSEFAVSVGGRNNDISGASWSVIAGGYDNLISGKTTNSIGGGYSNQIQGVLASVIAGGYDNLVSGNLESAGAIVGGVNNKVEKSHYGFVGAGASNTIQEESDGAVVVGGLGNILKGTNSFIGGGQENVVSGTYGVALGSFAKVRHNGAFVFSDGTPATAFSSGSNTLLMSFKSGVYVQSDSGLYVNGNPVMTGASDLDTDTLQTVTDRGATTTNDITVADLLVQNNGQVRANGAGSLTLGNTNGGTIYVSGTSAKSIITPRVNHLYLQSNRDEDDIIFQAGEADVEMARFDSANQRFGIGTNNPQSRLHVGNATGNSLGLIFTNPTETVRQYFADDSADSDFFITYDGNGGAEITLQHDGKLALNASNGDNVGIGTVNPSAELEIASSAATLRLTDSDLTNHYSEIEKAGVYTYLSSRANAADGGFIFFGGGTDTEFMRIETDGDVGIGSNVPSAKLDVAGGIKLLDNNYLTWNSSNTRIVGNSDYLQLQVAASDKVRIQSDGNVGIGTTTPRTSLHVSRAGTTEGGIITIDNPNNSDGSYCGIEFINSTVGYPRSAIFAQRTGGYDAELTFHTSPTNEITGTDYPAATERMRIDHDGRVGIGSNSPAYVLDTVFAGDDGARLRSTDNHSSFYIQSAASYGGYIRFGDGANRYWINATSDDKLRFRPNASSLESATINFDATGNVGIGVLSPTEKLEVGTDTDVSAVIGKAHVGYMGQANSAFFGHVDYATTSNYAMKQNSAGNTMINVKAGGSIGFNIANATKAAINNGGDFYVDTDTLYVDASADSVGINDSTPSYPLDVNGIIRTQSGLLGTQFGTGPCTTIDGFFASTSTEDYGFQNALLMNDLAGFTKWAGVTIATSGLYKTRGGSAGSYTYSNEAGTGDFDRAFQANNHTIGSWYTDSGPDGDITTGVASTGVIELYFNGVKSLNYSAQAAAIFGSASFRATHVKIEALRTGAWQTILDTTENTKTALIARINSNGGGANATTGLRYSFAKAGSYFRINNLYAADYDLGNDLSYGGQYYIDKYYDGRHYADLRPVTDGGANLGTSSVRYGSSYIDYGRFTNNVGIGTDTLTYNLNVVSNSDILAHFKSTDNKASILIQDNDTAGYVSAENNLLSIGPNNGTHTGNLNINVTNSRVGIGTNVPDLLLHVKSTGVRLEEQVGSRHLDIFPAAAGTNHKFIGDNTSAGYEFHNNGGLLASFDNVNNYFANNVGIGSATPAFELDVVGTIHGTSGNFENGITIDGNPVVTGTSAFESDTLQTVTDQGNITTNNIIIENNGNDPEYGALTISGGYALAHLRSTGTVAYLQFQNSTTSYGTMSNVGMTIGNNGHDAYVTNRQALGNLYLATSGEARVTIKPDGDVGIGSITPQGLLDVKADTDQNIFLGRARFGSHVTDYLYLSHYDNATSTSYALKQSPAGSTAINAKASQNVSMSVNNSDIVFVQGSTSRVGIGTTGPNQLLHVDGKTQLGTNGFTEGGLIINYASLSETKGGAATLLGNAVYAGTTNNTFRRTKGDAGNYILMTYNRGIAFHTNVTGNTSDDYSIDNHEQMRITTGGSVGIGTTEPAKTLDIDGDTRVKNAEFQVTSSSAYTTHLNYLDGGNNYISQANGGGTFFRNNGGTLVSISSVGTLNVGAAGVTNTRLHVTGAASDSLAKFKDGSDGVEITTRGASRQQIDFLGSNTSAINAKGSLFINYDSDNDGSNDTITFARNGVDEAGTVDMIIKEGNVGIGSTSPARKLDVSTNGSDTYGIRNSYGPSHYMEMAHNRFNAVGNNYIRFNIDDSTKMTIVDSDFGGGVNGVGIGTTSPSYELDVVGTTRSTYYIGGAYLEENASSSKLKFYTDGTVLVMDEDGELKPCEKENDTLVFGVSKRDFDSPVVLGAEPILVTGPIKVGDYIVTSSKQGHGQAMKEQKLGTIIAQAMESGDGESYNIKAMIRKM